MSKYKVGDKFVIEINFEYFDNYKIKETDLILSDYTLNKLQKYEDDIASKTYEDGLNDAWELARKMNSELTATDLELIFGIGNASASVIYSKVLKNLTPQEALAKIETYEESKAIKVGDVVRRISGNEEYLIITEEEDDSVYEYGVIDLKSMTIDRITGDLSKFEKTGRHIDIEHLFEQIRGNE